MTTTTQHVHARSDRGTSAFLRSVLAWVVILAVMAVLAVAVLIPRIGGATPYTILTGSMQPQYPPGTLVVVKPSDMADIRVGDVVTYQLESGRPTVVTHRVVARGVDANSAPVLRMQGDANSAPDQNWVRAEQVRGRLWYAVPQLGRVSNVLTGSERQLAVVIVAAGLLSYSGFMFVSTARDRRTRQRREERSS